MIPLPESMVRDAQVALSTSRLDIRLQFFGTVLDFFLLGTLTMQLYIYHYSFPNDKHSLKFLVFAVYFTEVVQVFREGTNVIYWVTHDILCLNNAYLSLFDAPLTASLVGCIVRFFICRQIWKMGKGTGYDYVCAMILEVSALQVLGSFIETWTHVGESLSHEISASSLKYPIVWLATEATADFLLAMTAIFLLSGRPVPRAPHIVGARVQKLIVWAMFLSAGVSTAILASFFTYSGNIYFVPAALVLGKFYSNVLLAALNHRQCADQVHDSQPDTCTVNGDEKECCYPAPMEPYLYNSLA